MIIGLIERVWLFLSIFRALLIGEYSEFLVNEIEPMRLIELILSL